MVPVSRFNKPLKTDIQDTYNPVVAPLQHIPSAIDEATDWAKNTALKEKQNEILLSGLNKALKSIQVIDVDKPDYLERRKYYQDRLQNMYKDLIANPEMNLNHHIDQFSSDLQEDLTNGELGAYATRFKNEAQYEAAKKKALAEGNVDYNIGGGGFLNKKTKLGEGQYYRGVADPTITKYQDVKDYLEDRLKNIKDSGGENAQLIEGYIRTGGWKGVSPQKVQQVLNSVFDKDFYSSLAGKNLLNMTRHELSQQYGDNIPREAFNKLLMEKVSGLMKYGVNTFSHGISSESLHPDSSYWKSKEWDKENQGSPAMSFPLNEESKVPYSSPSDFDNQLKTLQMQKLMVEEKYKKEGQLGKDAQAQKDYALKELDRQIAKITSDKKTYMSENNLTEEDLVENNINNFTGLKLWAAQHPALGWLGLLPNGKTKAEQGFEKYVKKYYTAEGGEALIPSKSPDQIKQEKMILDNLPKTQYFNELLANNKVDAKDLFIGKSSIDGKSYIFGRVEDDKSQKAVKIGPVNNFVKAPLLNKIYNDAVFEDISKAFDSAKGNNLPAKIESLSIGGLTTSVKKSVGKGLEGNYDIIIEDSSNNKKFLSGMDLAEAKEKVKKINEDKLNLTKEYMKAFPSASAEEIEEKVSNAIYNNLSNQ